MIDFRSGREPKSSSFDYIQIRIASPEEIRGPRDSKERERLELQGQRTWWSWGEVTKPETINYRSFKPERDGLFCERIFGPVKDWECHCGKYKRIRYRGVLCDRCGVEVTLSRVRRERMGHIELAVPVAHIWFFKTLPSPMGNLVDLTLRDLEKVIYYSNYVVIDPGKQDVIENQLLDEDEFLNLKQKAKDEGDHAFLADIGAPAVRELLKRIDVDKVAEELRAGLVDEGSQHRKKQMLKRLKVVDAFRNSGDSGQERNKAEWLIMDVIPVIPPDLRPLVPLDGGRFATSDLNDLYRRGLNRNNRLMKLISHRAPEVILRNEKRMLQEAVDALFDNGRRSKAIRGRGKRPLKSLSDMLKGKQGRFRQNLLGKRVDYSGRSVIVLGPELRLHQCGLPKAMAVELFKPFIMSRLVARKAVQNIKAAEKYVDSMTEEVWDVLEEVIAEHPVLLNRAPTLHRLGIQAFEPVLVEGKAIQVHPLVCHAFNADFDGDQMAVHLPLSAEAQAEARILMLSANNILSPAHGRPLTTPTQDMVLGGYYLTYSEHDLASTTSEELAKKLNVQGIKRFASEEEVERAIEAEQVELQQPIEYRRGEEVLLTTPGRVIFNLEVERSLLEALEADEAPEDLPYVNATLSKKEMDVFISDLAERYGAQVIGDVLDTVKALGFKYATDAGVTISKNDIVIPESKDEILSGYETRVREVEALYERGLITEEERHESIVNLWTEATEDVAEAMEKNLNEPNPLDMKANPGT